MFKKCYKKFISAVMILSLGMSLTACGVKEAPKDKPINNAVNLVQSVEIGEVETKEVDEEFVNATADFSVNLFKVSAMEDVDAGKNVLISPQSVITAMSMTTNGANGNTLAELENAMYGGMEVSEYNKYMKDYSGRLTSDQEVDFYLANSIWIKDDPRLQVREDFLKVCKSYYASGVYTESFDKETTDKINSWVKDNTKDMIDSIINEIPEDVVMYLVNATAFEGEWMVEYKETQVKDNEIFTNSKGEEEKVVMLSSLEEWYLSDDMASGFMKYYKGGNYAFVAMLPNEGVAMDDYIASLTGEKLIETYNNREFVDVGVMIPEFTYEYDRELSEDFEDLGVTTAFDGRVSDFSGIGESSAGNLYISRILHKTYIELDRKGTKAAAVTAVEVATESCAEPVRYESVYLNRPFYYAIVDCKTGLPVFMGVVNTVN